MLEMAIKELLNWTWIFFRREDRCQGWNPHKLNLIVKLLVDQRCNLKFSSLTNCAEKSNLSTAVEYAGVNGRISSYRSSIVSLFVVCSCSPNSISPFMEWAKRAPSRQTWQSINFGPPLPLRRLLRREEETALLSKGSSTEDANWDRFVRLEIIILPLPWILTHGTSFIFTLFLRWD